jgi:hypothetical protein
MGGNAVLTWLTGFGWVLDVTASEGRRPRDERRRPRPFGRGDGLLSSRPEQPSKDEQVEDHFFPTLAAPGLTFPADVILETLRASALQIEPSAPFSDGPLHLRAVTGGLVPWTYFTLPRRQSVIPPADVWLAAAEVKPNSADVVVPARRRAIFAGQVRGVLAERVIVSTQLDPFLTLRALSAYSGLSVRKLRDFLDDVTHPLPHYRVGGKILVRRSEFDAWIAVYRRRGLVDVDQIVDEMLKDVRTVEQQPERRR